MVARARVLTLRGRLVVRDGHEVDVVAALAEYVEEVAASEEVDHSRE
jgi:hypothetical protein